MGWGAERAQGKKLGSGKMAKITSHILQPQVWPHSQLSLACICKEVSYDNLTIAEFYLDILGN